MQGISGTLTPSSCIELADGIWIYSVLVVDKWPCTIMDAGSGVGQLLLRLSFLLAPSKYQLKGFEIDSIKEQKSQDIQVLITTRMLTHQELVIQWIAENANSCSFQHASVAAVGKLDAHIVISFWEGWSPKDKHCLGMACSGGSVRLVVIIQRHVRDTNSLMVDNGFPRSWLLHNHEVKLQGSNQVFHAFYFRLFKDLPPQ